MKYIKLLSNVSSNKTTRLTSCYLVDTWHKTKYDRNRMHFVEERVTSMSDFKKVGQIIERNKVETEKEVKGVKNPKQTFVDDGRSITDMNIEGFSWYMPKKYTQERQSLSDLKLTRKERVAMVLGALQAILPIAITILLLFFGAFLIIALWLN